MTTTAERPGAAIRALLLVQLFIGYEWLSSGLTKLARGDFASGLAADLGERAHGAPGWYRGFLDGVVVPHARLFGRLIESGEVATGAVLIATALCLILGERRLSARGRRLAHAAIAAAALAGMVLVGNFELANGGAFGALIGGDSFDEGVDLDTLMLGMQLVLLCLNAAALRRRAPRRVAAPGPVSPGGGWRGAASGVAAASARRMWRSGSGRGG